MIDPSVRVWVPPPLDSVGLAVGLHHVDLVDRVDDVAVRGELVVGPERRSPLTALPEIVYVSRRSARLSGTMKRPFTIGQYGPVAAFRRRPGR